MQRTNEEALDLFADLIDPVADIIKDKAVSSAIVEGDKLKAIKWAIKNHKQSIIQVLALIDGIPVSEYKVSVITLPLKLVELLNLPEVQDLFSAQVQIDDAAFSGPATENTEDGAN